MTWILIDKNVMVPMRDGVQLATDIYRLEGASPMPVLVVRTPYNKDWAPNQPVEQLPQLMKGTLASPDKGHPLDGNVAHPPLESKQRAPTWSFQRSKRPLAARSHRWMSSEVIRSRPAQSRSVSPIFRLCS